MNLYNILAENYSQVFPLDPARAGFVLSLLPPGSNEILDLGCATGDLDFDLAQRGARVTGIDLNGKMIGIAEERRGILEKNRKNLSFYAGDMLDFQEIAGDRKYGSAVCFGNTLPHLEDQNTVDLLFQRVYDALLPGGFFIVQILNYDKILKEKKGSFTDIETESLVFSRKYDFYPQGKLRFTITLTDRQAGISQSDSTLLLPLTQEEMKTAGKKAGFKSLNCYSGYDRSPVKETSSALLYCFIK